MATERVDIVISQKGGRQVKRTFDEIGDKAKRSGGAVSLFKKILGGLGVAAVAKSLLATADAYTNMQNQIRLVTKDTAELNVVTESLLETANKTRSSLDATAALYVKTSRSAKALGLSQKEVLSFTEQLNQAVILSGSSGQEASAGIRQLGQAIGSGVLRGDELNSVLENTSEVAQVIAKGMGVTIGQLRALGSEGKITAQEIVSSFAKAREELAERFGKTVPTLAQAIQVASNNWKVFIGGLDTSTGVTGLLAQGILALATNMETFARAAGVVAFTIGVVLARRAIPAAIKAVADFTLAMAANPLGAVAVAITATVAALVAFSDQITVTKDGFITLADVGVGAWTLIQLKLDQFLTFAETAWAQFLDLVENTFGSVDESGQGMFDGLVREGESWVRFMARAMDGAIGMFIGLWEAAKNVVENITVLFKDFGSRVVEFFTSGFDISVFSRQGALIGRGFGDAFINGIAEGVDGFTFFQDSLTALGEASEAAALERHAAEARDRSARNQAAAGLSIDPGAATPLAQKRKGPTFNELIGEMVQEGRVLRENVETRNQLATVLMFESELKRNLTESERTQVEALTASNDALQLKVGLLDGLTEPQRALKEETAALNQLLVEQPQLVNEITQAMAELQLNFLKNKKGQGFAEAFTDQTRIMVLATRNATTEMGKLFGSAFEGVTTGFADAAAQSLVFGEDFAQNIKKAAQSLITDMLSALIKIGIQLLFNKALTESNIVGQAGNAVGGVIGGIAGRASGGYTGDAPTNRVTGTHHGGEFVMNAAATKRIGRRTLTAANNGGSLGGGETTMNVTLINQDIPGIEFEANQLTVRDVEIIAKRKVREEAGTVLAGEVSNASSKFSRTLQQVTDVKRNRT